MSAPIIAESERGPGYGIAIVNAGDSDWTRHRYLLAFGAYGEERLMVWANSLDDALDEAIDWIVDNAPGLLADEAVAEEYKRLLEEGERPCDECEGAADGPHGAGMCEECGGSGVRRMTEEEAQEESTVDTTCGGNCGNYIHSWEWAVIAEDPTRAEILSLLDRA